MDVVTSTCPVILMLAFVENMVRRGICWYSDTSVPTHVKGGVLDFVWGKPSCLQYFMMETIAGWLDVQILLVVTSHPCWAMMIFAAL